MWLWLLGESQGEWCLMSMLERHVFDSQKKKQKGRERESKKSQASSITWRWWPILGASWNMW